MNWPVLSVPPGFRARVADLTPAELGAASGAVFQDLNELGPATALPEAPARAVLALQRAAQSLLPGGD